MQPTIETPLTPPRRPLDVEDYIDIIRRHRSWILGPAFAGLVIGVVGAFLWPDRYVSAGAIRVVPPQVPGRLVPTNLSEEVAQRINAMYQGIVSRPNLTNLITTLNLYPTERKSKPIEDIIDDMRKHIIMSPLAGISRLGPQQARQSGIAFSIAFSYEDRRKAQEVTRELISKFIDESLRTRSAQSASTTEFLRDQLASAKKELDDADRRIVDFRQKNPAEVTETDEQLLARINGLETTVQNITLSISRANQDKMQLESQLRVLKEGVVAVAPPGTPEQAVVQVKNERLAELDREIARMESTLAILKESYKDDYPEVQKINGYLTARKQQRDALLASGEPKETSKPMTTPVRPAITDPRQAREVRDVVSKIVQTEGQIQAKDQEIEDLTRQASEIRKRIQIYQSRMEASPASRQQLLQLLRDKEMSQQHYESMAAKVQDSSLATDLENRRQGETLELLEDAYLPADPVAPKRLPIILGGLGAGIALGLLLTGIREVKDTSLKNLKDVRAYTKLAVLGSIPLLESDFVVRRRRRTAIVAWAAAFLIGVLLMSGSVYYYFITRT